MRACPKCGIKIQWNAKKQCWECKYCTWQETTDDTTEGSYQKYDDTTEDTTEGGHQR